jgi:hypothetical protein
MVLPTKFAMFYPSLRIFGSMFNYIIPIDERQQGQTFQANKKPASKKVWWQVLF